MNLEECRATMDACRQAADREAQLLKDSQRALERLDAFYGQLDESERQLADQVISDWTLSEDPKVRFDALHLISEFQIADALPALRKLAERLAASDAVSAPYELRKVNCIIGGLEGSSSPK
ncbi:MAG TPA: hypothetical protein VNO22_18770 [Planctomycetota bacterium]|nr:hypothetical protein [Planctomycetota bacterium]